MVIEPWGESIVRVQRTPAQPGKAATPSLVVIAVQPPIPFKIDRSDATNISATLPRLRVVVSRSDGRLRFEQPDGKLHLEESADAARFTPARRPDLQQIQQSFQSPAGRRGPLV